MVNINTNLSALLVQTSLANSTNALNTAIERMTTGFKINHAKDNAANYSIATNMTSKISAFDVAENNALMGLDMLNTASSSLSLIDTALARLRSLAVQSSNGTYGNTSLEAINSEANALVDEILREYNNAEYSGRKLFSGDTASATTSADLVKPIVQRDTTSMTALADVDENTVISSGTYSISSAEELKKLADMTNSGKVTGGEFVLGADIDLSVYSTGEGWTPIGDYDSMIFFDGTFDGNGYVISNLYINGPDGEGQGLFAMSQNGTFKNVALEDVDINGGVRVGGLLGVASSTTGNTDVTITNCYVTGDVSSQRSSDGGLVGEVNRCDLTITDSYVTANVSGQVSGTGGIVGYAIACDLRITGSYVTGDISGFRYVGGLLGNSLSNINLTITNSYVTGDVSGVKSCVGGLVGLANVSNLRITDSYVTGNVSGKETIGGLAGYVVYGALTITNSYVTGDASGQDEVGGLVGVLYDVSSAAISNSYVLTNSDDLDSIFIGELRGTGTPSFEITNSYYSSFYDGKGIDFVAGYGNQTSSAGATGGAVSYTGGVPFTQSNTSSSVTAGGVNRVTLQVGIDSSEASQLTLDLSFSLNNLESLRDIGLGNGDYISQVDEIIASVAAKQTELGAAENRLESALDQISIQYDNLVSSRSTIRDADIAEESSEYIKMQILQQASATLLATANQTPAIALQLL